MTFLRILLSAIINVLTACIVHVILNYYILFVATVRLYFANFVHI